MAKRSTHPALTTARLAEIRRLRTVVETEKPAIIEKGRQHLARRQRIVKAIEALKKAQQELCLTLDEVAGRSGIAKPNLSRLFNDAEPNPTIDTLLRVADAVHVPLLK